MESAIEHIPESFGQVVMLYINCSVNGYPVKAFVDSGRGVHCCKPGNFHLNFCFSPKQN